MNIIHCPCFKLRSIYFGQTVECVRVLQPQDGLCEHLLPLCACVQITDCWTGMTGVFSCNLVYYLCERALYLHRKGPKFMQYTVETVRRTALSYCTECQTNCGPPNLVRAFRRNMHHFIIDLSIIMIYWRCFSQRILRFEICSVLLICSVFFHNE